MRTHGTARSHGGELAHQDGGCLRSDSYAHRDQHTDTCSGSSDEYVYSDTSAADAYSDGHSYAEARATDAHAEAGVGGSLRVSGGERR